jgi:adenine/guanine/hypoxanthine permease
LKAVSTYRWLDRCFAISERNSTLSRELIAGLTTFAAMSYVVIVNPLILASSGMDRQGLLLATVVSAAFGTLLMALWANLPLALAPGMGSNVVFAQILVRQMGISWKIGLTMVFLNAVVFTVLSLTRWRQKIVSAFPECIKLGMQCSIGIFIAFLGLKSGGLIVSNPASYVSLANLTDPRALLTLLGLIFIPVLFILRVPGALLVSITVSTVIGCFLRGHDGHLITTRPTSLIALPHISTGLFFAFDFKGFFSKFLLLLPITIYFLLSEFFSATATIVGVTRRAGILVGEGKTPNERAAFTSDALASVLGAAVGTSTVTAYVESVTGVEAGGRTGLSGVVVSILFAIALLFAPLLSIVPPQATAPVLVLVGVLMMEGVMEVDLTKSEISLPPLFMLIITVCTSDLMAGLAVGCFVYTAILLSLRKWNSITRMILLLDAVFVIYLILRNSIA